MMRVNLNYNNIEYYQNIIQKLYFTDNHKSMNIFYNLIEYYNIYKKDTVAILLTSLCLWRPSLKNEVIKYTKAKLMNSFPLLFIQFINNFNSIFIDHAINDATKEIEADKIGSFFTYILNLDSLGLALKNIYQKTLKYKPYNLIFSLRNLKSIILISINILFRLFI